MKIETKKYITFHDEPRFYHFYSELSLNDRKYFGVSLNKNKELSIIKSINESIERASLSQENHNYNKLIDVSNHNSHYHIPNINQFTSSSMNFKSEQFKWIKSRLNFRHDVLLPAQLIYANYDLNDEPILKMPISSGAACDKDLKKAFMRGFFELIERDSFMITWLTLTQKKIRIKKNSSAYKLKKYLNRYLLDLYIFDTTTDLGIPSALSIIIDKSTIGPAVSLGIKSSFNYKDAIEGAIYESLQVRIWNRLRKSTNAVSKKDIIETIDDRRNYWYSTNNIHKIEQFINCSKYVDYDLKTSYNKKINDFINNHDIYTTDISIKNNLNINCVKVNIPFLHSLHLNELFKSETSEHLSSFCKKNNVDIINTLPHPFL